MTAINTTVIRGPIDCYVAPVGTAFTGVLSLGSLNAAWKKLGARGYRSQDTGGITITYRQKLEEWRGENTVIQDVGRSEEDVTVAFSLADVSAEALSYAMNSNAVTTTPPATGVRGTKKMFFARGPEVSPLALLLVLKSSYVTGEKGVFYYPKVFQNADIDIQVNKSGPAMTKFEWKVLEGPNATDTDPDMGFYEVVSAPAN